MEYTGERFIPNYDGAEIEAEHIHRYRIIKDGIKKMRVLDAGCGTGYGSYILAQTAESVTGIDISDETIQWCREHYESQDNLIFLQASLDELPFENGEFDCIINLEVIEHVDKDIQNKFLKEAKRVLKPTGVLIMSTPNKTNYTDKSGYHNPYHVSEFYLDEFKDYLAKEFDAVKLYNQTLYTVSSILNESVIDEQVQIIKNKDIDPSEKYMIAVCGNTEEAISIMDLSSVYKYDNPQGLSTASLYAATEGNLYSQQFKQSNALTAQADNNFSITFNISQYSGSNRFRFDPIENFFSVCNIENILTDGKVESVLPLNALELHKTGFIFLNIDPQFEIIGNFTEATYLTLEGYFKILSHVEIGEFVDAFYQRMMDQNKKVISTEQISQMFSETERLISEQGIALQIIQAKLLEHQNELFNNNQLLHMISEENRILSNVVTMVAEQGELLKNTLLKRGKISSTLHRAYHMLGKLLRKLGYGHKNRD